MDKKTKVALWIEALLMTLLIFAAVILSYFSSVSKLNSVLEESGSYENIAEISQTALKNKIPEEVKTKPIAYATINWGIDRFINPELIEKLSEPTLNLLVKMAQTPTTIEGTNIVLDTTKYKTNLSADINALNIPQVLKDAGNEFVAAIPAELNIVDLTKHPNSILAKVINTRERLSQLKDLVLVLTLAVIAGAIMIGVWSRENLTKDLKALSLTAIAGGGATLLATILLALTANNIAIYAGDTVLDAQINTFFVDLANYYLLNVAQWGVVILAVSLFVYIFTIEKVQIAIKQGYAKTKDFIKPSENKTKKQNNKKKN